MYICSHSSSHSHFLAKYKALRLEDCLYSCPQTLLGTALWCKTIFYMTDCQKETSMNNSIFSTNIRVYASGSGVLTATLSFGISNKKKDTSQEALSATIVLILNKKKFKCSHSHLQFSMLPAFAYSLPLQVTRHTLPLTLLNVKKLLAFCFADQAIHYFHIFFLPCFIQINYLQSHNCFCTMLKLFSIISH